ncbi:diacylglycerol kinase zeta isoform X5, partial [Clarias magur]
MAEASECSRGAWSRAAETPAPASAPSPAPSPADSVLLVMAPALEDVAEEEDVFVLQQDGLKQLESDFLPLTIRKQVSY